MNSFRLEAADILVNIEIGKNPLARIKRWALGSPYSHVFMYMGQMALLVDNVILRHPMLFESSGRGVVIQSLSNRYGQKVVVMRLKSEFDRKRIPGVLYGAIMLASDAQSYYDYLCIIRFVLPRIIFKKLRLPMPLSWHRDERQICSEAIYEVIYRAGLRDILLPYCTPPLPGDFVTDSPLLEEVGVVSLSEELLDR